MGEAGRPPSAAAPFLALLAAGGLAGLGHAPNGVWPLTVLGLAALIRLAVGGRRRAAACAWAFGFGYFLVALRWLVEPFRIEAQDAWMAPFALPLAAAGLAALMGAAGALRPRHPSLAGDVAFAALLAAAEWLRGHVLGGFPWALPAYVWIDTPAAQLARIAGPYGLTFLTLLLAAGLAAASRRPASPSPAVPSPAVPSLAVAALAACGLGASLALDAAPPPPASDAPQIRIVQPAVPQRQKWDPALVDGHFERLVALTGAAPAADLAIWPETALVWPLDGAGAALARAARAAEGRPVIVGANRFEGVRVYNALAVLGPGGEVAARYDKRRLVPFGEYVPLGGLSRWLGLRSMAARDGFGFSAGAGPLTLEVPGIGRIRPLICYEAIFPQAARTEPRPDALVQITNDAWFGTGSGPQQHLVQARFRAIETGLPLLRAANTGISAVIDARGGLAGHLPLGIAGTLDRPLPAAAPPPLYARSGDWPTLAALALVLLGAAARLRRPIDPARRLQ